MNFYNIRYAILTLIMLIIVVIFLKITKKQVTTKLTIPIFIIFFIVQKIIFSIIPEVDSLTFESVEDAMKYSFPGERILNKIDGESVVFIEYGEDEHKVSYTYFVKENEKIKFKKLHDDDIRFFGFDYGTGTIIKTKQGQTLLKVNYIQVKDKTKDIEITDTIDSKFEKNIYEEELSSIIFYYTILNDEDITNDYYLVVNNRLIDIKPYLK